MAKTAIHIAISSSNVIEYILEVIAGGGGHVWFMLEEQRGGARHVYPGGVGCGTQTSPLLQEHSVDGTTSSQRSPENVQRKYH